MKICLVHEEYPQETNFGGIATYQKNLAEELVKYNHCVIVICRSLKENQHYFENGVEIYRIYNKAKKINECINYRKKVAKLLFELQEKQMIDIIETPDWGASTIYFEKIRKIPLIVRLHTPLKIWLKYNKNDFGIVKNKMLYWEEKMINKADVIACCSGLLKNMVEDEFNISKNQISVNPNPANVNDFYRDDKIEKDDILLYVGSLEERKGILQYAKSLNIVLKELPNVKVYFIGKDTTRNSSNVSTKYLVKKIVKEVVLV